MSEHVRRSVVAGTWYPGEPSMLQKTIKDYFDNVGDNRVEGRVVGLISPHAGYTFSGQVAAYGYKQIAGSSFDVVVLIGPIHQMLFGKYLISSADCYETPLGRVSIEKKLVEQLKDQIEITEVGSENEHSIEIQLPFLQVALKDFSILPIMVGLIDPYGVDDIVMSLSNVLKDKNFLLVASSDLHHISDYREVEKRDEELISALSRFDYEEIMDVLSRPDSTVCGRVPIAITISVAKRMGADRLHVLSHTNSAEITGQRIPGQYTVGYLSAAIVKE